MDQSRLRIVTFPDAALRVKAETVRRFDGDLVRLVDVMYGVLRNAGGCGLAAVQVGVPLRVVIAMDFGGREAILVNPIVTNRQGWVEANESCLSLPGVSARVGRAARVSVEACDLLGRLLQVDFAGMLARIVQHEVDHLDGVLFIDRVVDQAGMFPGKQRPAA